MTEPPTGRHRLIGERPGAHPPVVPLAPEPEPEPAEPRATVRGWIVTGLLVTGAVAAAGFAIATNDPPLSPAPTATSTSSTPPATAAPEPTPLVITALVAQTCARIGVEPSADGVWDAAAALEVPPTSLTTDEAWALVDLSARLDCPQYAALVDATIASVGG